MASSEAVSPAALLGRTLEARGLTIATAESCTGGLVGVWLTDIPGSSDYYLGGVVAYSNEAKRLLLGVEPATLAEHGAVSASVARAMADGVRRSLGADLGISLTGIAGPGGGSPAKPVGLVFIGLARTEGVSATRHLFHGDRGTVRTAAAEAALVCVLRSLNDDPAQATIDTLR